MLPSEKSERLVRRVMTTALVLLVLFFLIWMIQFIVKNYSKALKQRELPPDARTPVVWLT
jgi:Na+-transporting methylmalonyl-CoA/oxaloacetate decarboxylase gamma subunit